MASLIASFLLVNLNNTFTKIAWATDEKIGPVKRVPTRDLTAETWLNALGDQPFNHAVLASVVPNQTPTVLENLPGPVTVVSAAVKLNVGIDFPHPESIGADRLANAAATVAKYGSPSIVVDFGTATTFDVISRAGAYTGGVIAPGLDAMTDYLHRRTALLPKIELTEPPTAIGKTTRDAMLSGAVHGYRGLVREILRQVRQELEGGENAPVIATGGYAELLAAKLPEVGLVDPTLTLEGLRIIGLLNR